MADPLPDLEPLFSYFLCSVNARLWTAGTIANPLLVPECHMQEEQGRLIPLMGTGAAPLFSHLLCSFEAEPPDRGLWEGIAEPNPDSDCHAQEEQDRLMSLMGTGAALATATGLAGKRGGDGDTVAGLSDGPKGIAREASAAKAGEEAFILSIASCTVHEERQDPNTLTATLEQQRCLVFCALARMHSILILSSLEDLECTGYASPVLIPQLIRSSMLSMQKSQ